MWKCEKKKIFCFCFLAKEVRSIRRSKLRSAIFFGRRRFFPKISQNLLTAQKSWRKTLDQSKTKHENLCRWKLFLFFCFWRYIAACEQNKLNLVDTDLLRCLSCDHIPKLLVEKYLIEICRSQNVPFEPNESVMVQDEFWAVGSKYVQENNSSSNDEKRFPPPPNDFSQGGAAARPHYAPPPPPVHVRSIFRWKFCFTLFFFLLLFQYENPPPRYMDVSWTWSFIVAKKIIERSKMTANGRHFYSCSTDCKQMCSFLDVRHLVHRLVNRSVLEKLDRLEIPIWNQCQ